MFWSRIFCTWSIMVPTRTCRPWKPVRVKNVEPNTLSAIEKEAWKYS